MKRKLLIVYVFVAFVLLCTNVYAALTMDLSLVPVSEKVKQGSDLVVTVKLNNISAPLSSIEGYINVDENVLEPISADMIKGDKIAIKADGKVLSELDYIFNPTDTGADYDVIFNTKKENIENNDCFFIMDLRKDMQGNCDLMTLNFKVKENATVSQATQAVKFKISSAVSASNTKDKAENISANLNFEVVDKNADIDDPKPDEPKAPTGTVSYSTTSETTDEVTATLTVDDGVTVTNNDGKKTRVFKENGTFVFEFEDSNGNKGTAEAKVTWIKAKNTDTPEKKELKGTINYSTTKETSDKVIATLTVDSGVTITNNGGRNTHTFTQNGEFTFTFKDNDGNEGKATAKVTWIKKAENTNTNSNNTNTNNTNTNNNKNVNTNKTVNDTTVSGNKIPKAGAKMLILPVIVFVVLGYVSYIKYLKYKEI